MPYGNLSIKKKWIALGTLIGLPSVYLTIDFIYNYYTYVSPDSTIHKLLLPILPVSFLERFFTLFHTSAAFPVSISSISVLSLAQGMYLAILSPYLLTYAIIFLFFGGVISSIRRESRIKRFNLAMMMLILVVGGFLSSLLLESGEIPRADIFLYPYIICLAALGVYNVLKGRVIIWLALCLVILGIIYYLETTMLNHGGIPLSAVPAPDQTTSSLFSINLVLGLGILVWKAIQGSLLGEHRPRIQRVMGTAGDRRLGTSVIVVLGLIAIVSISQVSVLAQTSPYLSESSFNPLQGWLNTNIKSGDTILTNGNRTLLALANDSLLQLVHQDRVKVLTVPSAQGNWSLLAPNQYLVVFKIAQYTLTDSYNSKYYVPVEQVSTLVVSSGYVDVYQASR